MQRYRIFLTLLCCISAYFSTHGVEILKGNQDIANQSFSFSIGVDDASTRGTDFFVGAAIAGQAKEFAIAKIVDAQNKFVPLAQTNTMVNGQGNQPNPLFDAGFRFMRVLERAGTQRLAVVKSGVDNQSNVYVIDRFFRADDIPVLQALNIKDATGMMTAANIVGLAGAYEMMVFAPVIGSGGVHFGDANSGIAVLHIMDAATEDNKGRRLLVQIDVGADAAPDSQTPRAALLERSTDAIKLTNDVVSIEDAVDMWWDGELRVVYGALRVIGADGAQDGVRAVFIGGFDDENSALKIRAIAPEAVFTAGSNDEIVGARDADAQVHIFVVRTMHTSTGLPYLIVVGGNGDSRNKVFALPLVNKRNNMGVVPTSDLNAHGTIANKNALPVDVLSNQDVPRFLGRKFDDAAESSTDMPRSSDQATQIGGGALPAGDISAIRVVGDAVFVSVSEPDVDQRAGIFYSRALFDDHARIKGWTQWQPVGGTTDIVYGFGIDTTVGNIIFTTGVDDAQITTVKRTNWQSNDLQLRGTLPDLIRDLLPRENGGIRGLFHFSGDTPGLHDITLTAATGNPGIALIQTGHRDNNGVLVPETGNFSLDAVSFEQGTITHTLPGSTSPLYVTISGGVLNELGPITAAEIASNGQDGWLCVGGINGVAVLVHEDGSGWDTTQQLGNHFDGLAASMSFKKIGNYAFVRKLVCDNNFLYILTDHQLDRIDLQASNFATGDVKVDILARSIDFREKSTLLDVLISEKFALLATSVGLFRIGNNKNIMTSTDAMDVGWTHVDIPNQHGPVVAIVAHSFTGRSQDVTRYHGGMISLLGSYRGKEQGQLNRFSITETVCDPVSEHTFKPVPDIFKLVPFGNGGTTYFANFGNIRDVIAYDGALFFNGRDREQTENPFVDNNTRSNKTTLPLDLTDANDVIKIVRDTASGSWFIVGDFGLRINE